MGSIGESGAGENRVNKALLRLFCPAVFFFASLGSAVAEQAGGVTAGVSGGGNVVRPAASDPRNAIMLTPEAFIALESGRRQEIVRAWADGRASGAGPRILLLIQAALADPVLGVRREAVRCLRQVANAATRERLLKRADVTDPASLPSLLESLIKLTGDSDSGLRGDAATLLLLIQQRPSEQVERVAVARFSEESDPSARAKFLG